MVDTARKTEYCHFEVVSMRSRYITEESLYIQQNRTYLGFEEPIPTRPVDEVSLPHEGPDATLWLIRDGKAQILATRQDQQIVQYDHEKVGWLGTFGVHVALTAHWLRAGDGFVITTLDRVCEPGPVDHRDGRPRPTVYE